MHKGRGEKLRKYYKGAALVCQWMGRPMVSPRIQLVHTTFAMLISGREDPEGPAAREEDSSVLWIHVEFTQSELHASKVFILIPTNNCSSLVSSKKLICVTDRHHCGKLQLVKMQRTRDHALFSPA